MALLRHHPMRHRSNHDPYGTRIIRIDTIGHLLSGCLYTIQKQVYYEYSVS